MRLKSLGNAVLLLGVISQGVLAQMSSEAQVFQHLPWTIVNSIESVEPKELAELKSRIGPNSQISDLGGPFEAGCIVTDKPSRRFLLGGYAGTRWFVTYEPGGRGHHIVLAIFNLGPKGPEPCFLARGMAGKQDDWSNWRVNLADLRTALKDGKLTEDGGNELHY